MFGRRWLVLSGTVLAAVLIGILSIVTFRPATPASVSQGRHAASVTVSKRPVESVDGPMLGLTLAPGFPGIFESPTAPGISLATAREQAAKGLLVPQNKALGKPKKIVTTVFGNVEPNWPPPGPPPRELVGVAILYESGVCFFADPSGDKNKTFESILPDMDVTLESYDGKNKRQVYSVVDDGKRKYMVEKGGYQKVYDMGTRRNEVPPSVTFLVDGIEYRLIAASGDLNEKDLLKIAKEMR
jgi:hypothetical protein